MSWFRRTLKDEIRAWSPEPIIPPFPGASIWGATRPDTPDSALHIPTVWACVRLKADAVSGMALHRYRAAPDGTPVQIAPGPLLENPSSTRLLPEWIFDIVVSGELRGNIFGRIVARDGGDRPTQIELANPDSVTLSYDANRRLEYRFDSVLVPYDDVWHLRGYSYPGSAVGLSTITYGASTLGLAAFAEMFAYGFFADGCTPSSILTTDHPIDQAGAQTIKDRFKAAVNGREPAVLGLGVKYTAVQVSPEESQFLATQKFSVEQIARLFGVPATMVGGSMGDGMVYANVEQRSLDFLVYAVQPWLRRIEVAVSALLPPGEFVRFDTSSLLRTDAETRAKVQAIQIASRTRTITELRHLDGLPPLSAEQLTELELVPLTVTPLGGVKSKPSATGGGPGDEVVVGNGPQRGAVNVVVNTPEQRNVYHHHVHNEAAAPVVLPAPVVEFHEGRTTLYAPTTIAVPRPETRQLVKSVERDLDGNIARIVEEVTS